MKMESLANDIANMAVSNNNGTENPRFSLYKMRGSYNTQQKRRETILATRNQARYDLISHLRKIEYGNDDSEDATSEEESEDEDDFQRLYAEPKGFKNFIMLNEWLVDIPKDFHSTFVAVPCPVGKRCLIVCSRGKTKCYGKNGRFLKLFNTTLPGGSPFTAKRECTMIDTIFNFKQKVFYVVDLMVWQGRSFVACETEFRFHWIHNQFKEWEGNVSVLSEFNRFRFLTLPCIDCSGDSLKKMMMDTSYNFALDGVMFFHKQSHYLHGYSPLVGWLKPYMIPEVLNIGVNKKYLDETPFGYKCLSKYLSDQKEEKKKLREEILKAKESDAEIEEKINENNRKI